MTVSQATTGISGISKLCEVSGRLTSAWALLLVALGLVAFPAGSAHAAPPDANDDTASTFEDTATTIDVLANDTDPDGDPQTIISVDSPTTQGGTASINDNGTPGDPSDDSIDYTPPAGFVGTDTFTYSIDDDLGDTEGMTLCDLTMGR